MKKCYTYRDGSWLLTSELTDGRDEAASCKAPDGALFVTGGKKLSFEIIRNAHNVKNLVLLSSGLCFEKSFH